MRPYYTLIGARRIGVPADRAATVMNICMKYRYPYSDVTNDGETVSFLFSLFTASRIKRRLLDSGIDAEYGEAHGFSAAVMSFLRRPGLIIGVFIAAMIVFVSGRVVWDIRVSGDDSMSAAEIEELLGKCGFSVGCSTDFDADSVEIAALIREPRLAWLSVNLRGTVAEVEFHRKLVMPDKPDEIRPANVVAAHSGRVTEIIAYDGLCEVKAGDNVVEGELLISGCYGEKTPGLVVTRAAGRVMAETYRTFRVEIPYEYSEKVYTGAENYENFLFFFSKTIKVFGNYRNLGSTCDTIEYEQWVSVAGKRLPIGFSRSGLAEFETAAIRRTHAEAEALARMKISEEIKNTVCDGSLKVSEKTIIEGEDSLILIVEAIFVENIAKTAEFDVIYN